MSTVAAVLTPPIIPQSDYSIVQRPSLGGEKRVYLSNKPARKLGQLRVVADTGGVSTVAIATAGTGYADNDILNILGGGGKGAQIRVLTVTSGAVATLEIVKTGSGYTAASSGFTATTATGAGTGFVPGAVGTAQVIEYKFQSIPSSDTPGPIVAVVKTELRAPSDAVITYAGITGKFTSADWAANKRSDFPAGKGVELTGTFVMPVNASIPSITNATRGSKVVLYELPAYSDFNEAGTTNSKRIKWPVRGSKAIADQLETGNWIVPGKTEIGTLEMTGLSSGMDDGFQRYAGLKSTVMIINNHEEKVERERIFCLNFTPNLDENSPDSDNEDQLTLNGMFEVGAVLVAPGTP